MELVQKIDPLEPQRQDGTAYGSGGIPAPTNPAAGPTTTGYTSTEGVDQLTYIVGAEGLHLVSIAIGLISVSDAATSHFVRPVISYTVPTGNAGVEGVALVDAQIGADIGSLIKDSDGSAFAYSHGMDAKGAAQGATSAVSLPVIMKAGSTTVVRFHHTVTGACTTGGTYRISIAIYKL